MSRDGSTVRRRLATWRERIVTPITRRSLLRGLSASAVALAAPVLMRRPSFAGGNGAPKRLVLFTSGNGVPTEHFWPTDGATDFVGTVLAPLEPVRERLLVLRGLHHESAMLPGSVGSEHERGQAACFTGGLAIGGATVSHPTIDSIIAERIGGETPFDALHLGVDSSSNNPLRAAISWSGTNAPNPPMLDPRDVFDLVFADIEDDPSLQMAAARRREQRQAMLDRVRLELDDLRARVPSEDQPILQAHLDAIAEVHEQVGQTVDASCPVPDAPGEINVEPATFEQRGALQRELLALALSCDATRVATFMYGQFSSDQPFAHLGIPDQHHELSHANIGESEVRLNLAEVQRWYMSELAALVQRLDELGLMDTTLVAYSNELGEGRSHEHTNVPWLLFGDAGGYFASGRSLQYDTAHNAVLVSIAHAMGLEDIEVVGLPELGNGPLSGLTP